MYQVDERDRVLPLKLVPQSSVGAPLPILLADEHRAVLAFYLQETPVGADGSTVSPNDFDSSEPIAIVRFERCTAKVFGPPNDEAFSGHPLASRGLTPYSAFEVESSSWIRALERMNSVHPSHDPARFFSRRRHLIFAFHDSVFECVCEDLRWEETRGSLRSVVPRMLDLLG